MHFPKYIFAVVILLSTVSGECYREKCANSCKKGEILDQSTCTCKSCPNGQIANLEHCSKFDINKCKCIQCKKGYVYDLVDKICVPECPDNEIYQNCGSACPPTCDVPDPTICTEQCVRGCFCKDGLYRDLNDGQCVQKKDCSCSLENTQFCLCGPEEPATCKNPFVSNDNDCYEERPGCYCVEGTIRDTQTGQCVQPENCTCERAHEFYSLCGSACELTCSEPDPPKFCTLQCVQGCFCEDGYVRDEMGDCVLRDECACA